LMGTCIPMGSTSLSRAQAGGGNCNGNYTYPTIDWGR